MTMPGEKLQEIRKGLGLTYDEFALELGLIGTRVSNKTTIRRFERGHRPVPLPIARLAYLISLQPSIPVWPPYLVEEPHEPAAECDGVT